MSFNFKASDEARRNRLASMTDVQPAAETAPPAPRPGQFQGRTATPRGVPDPPRPDRRGPSPAPFGVRCRLAGSAREEPEGSRPAPADPGPLE